VTVIKDCSIADDNDVTTETEVDVVSERDV
jgi:hypothetical protein